MNGDIVLFSFPVVDAVSVCATNSIKLLNGSNINVSKFTTFLRPGPP